MAADPIINSLLDTDLYKYTMQQVMFSCYPDAMGKMSFRCRSGQLNLELDELRAQIDALGDLSLSEDELTWLGSLSFITPEFVSWLRTFRLNPAAVHLAESDGHLDITVTGKWAEITHFEIFILAIVSELHCRRAFQGQPERAGELRLHTKIQQLKAGLGSGDGFNLVDFGTRRRFSRQWQEYVVRTLQRELPSTFAGTSNLHLARTLGLKPVGTMAHEWLQAHQALGETLSDFQRDALLTWLGYYEGQLGVALTDTISMKAFLQDFDRELAMAYVGIRHDSGDPVDWGEQALSHYASLGIDARDKQFVFSDKLDFDTALMLYRHFSGRVKVSFGIGTYLTNDMGEAAPNIVLKLVELNGQPVAKLSDSPGKIMCEDDEYIARLRASFRKKAS
ncbi:hypothetical protein GZ77_05985 [Endozoicomonas montiporae]|uniref:Nicotinate phosphoribosyltransferase n=2 Tax=Endozoicomonas montiporae TaxID=1027273 RepID=A0A081NC43_9GAMM|nr:hypothetical protein GZ77_05985 [Endozoicomonas montiporae]